jgi:hypothetical protein
VPKIALILPRVTALPAWPEKFLKENKNKNKNLNF